MSIPTSDDTILEPDPRRQAAPTGPLHWVRRWYHSYPVPVDVLIAGVLVALNIVLMNATFHRDDLPYGPDKPWLPLGMGFLALAGVALALRRRFPLCSWAAIIVIPVIFEVTTKQVFQLDRTQTYLATACLVLITPIGTPIVLGSVASRYRAPTTWTAWGISVITPTAINVLLEPHKPETLFASFCLTLLADTIAVLVGISNRRTRLRIENLETRSARMALAGEQAALLAAAEERSRIAREMHDVVAHSLAVMITMADGAAATVERDPATAKQAIETLAEAGRSALADTRRLVGVLREDPSVVGSPTSAPGDSTSSVSSVGSRDATASPEPVPQRPSAARATSTSSEALADPDRPAAARRSRWSLGRKTASPGLSESSTAAAPEARGHEVRDVPVPEFAPLGTVAPVEPSAPIASLRRQATDSGGDRSRGDLPLAPAPEQADITELVKRFETAGVPVSYRWVGAALPADKALQLTVFRIAQEALTNVLRYAPTTPAVSVDVERHIGTVVLTVDNETAPGTRPMHGSGKGLIGMRERASVYGGTVQAGPTPTGWRVRAVLRWDEHDEGTSSWQTPL